MEASFFGCGPGPEVVALLAHLSQAYPGVTMLVANMIDIAAETWAYARSMVLESLAEPCWSPKLVEYRAQPACITDSDAMANAPTSGAAIAVVQNCFNEVPANRREQAVRNVVDAFTRLAPGAIGIIIDRAGYTGTDGMLELAQTLGVAHPKLRLLGDGQIREKCISCSDMLRTVPALITENMLHKWGGAEPQGWSTDGLIFANRIKYVAVAFEVSGGGA